MPAKWMTVLAVALLVVGCARVEKAGPPPVALKPTPQKAAMVVEVENFTLTDAKVQAAPKASGGKVVVLQSESSKAETTVNLAKGKYILVVHALGPSETEDAFYLTVGSRSAERLWPEAKGEIVAVPEVSLTQESDGPLKIILGFGEANVQLDRVEIKPAP